VSKYLDLRNGYSIDKLDEAVHIIKNGGLVVFPTETVYGIGANGLNDEAVKNIFKAKGRPSDNPLILHVSSISMVESIACDISEIEYKLMNKFFPGPLTLILKKKSCVSDVVSANLDTVGVRMPANKIAHDLICLSNVPIAAPSANVSGKPSGTNTNDIIEELGNKVDYIIDGGDSIGGLESTVVRVINGVIHILRPGKITKEQLEEYAPVIIDKHVLDDLDDDKVLSPGMKYKHYAPNTKCILVYSEDKDILINKIKELETDSSIVITNNDNINVFKNSISYGSSLDDISHNIFKLLRQVDKMDIDLVIIEGVSKKGLGLAIMNRLIRACAYNYIEV